MAIELVSKTIPSTVNYEGSTFTLAAAGKTLKIQISNDKLLEVEVPAGKKWSVGIRVTIEETTAS
jgi:hypothetical protein